jgi:hypothetical protein
MVERPLLTASATGLRAAANLRTPWIGHQAEGGTTNMMKAIKHLVLVALLASGALACNEHPSAVEPIPKVSAERNGGAPTPVDPTPYVDQIISQLCGFPTEAVLGGKSKVLDLPGGRLAITSPGFDVTLTNTASGRTHFFNATGVTRFSSLPNGDIEIVFTGHNLIAVEGRFLYTVGRFTEAVNPATGATVEPLQGHGLVQDVCDLLS